MKLLFIIDNLSTGGAQRQIVNLSIGLITRGHSVELFCYAPGDSLAQPLYNAKIPIHWYHKRSRFSIDVILALKKLINQRKYDLVLAYLPTPNFYAILAGRLLSHPRIPVVVSERRCDLPQGPMLMERFARQFYRWANTVITNSHQQRANLISEYPWIQECIATIYNGLDLNTFLPVSVEPDNNPLHLLTISGIAPHKNGLCLVNALRILGQRNGLHPKIDWIGKLPISGEGLKYLDEMSRAINAFGLTKQWQWLNQRSDIVHQLHTHDVLVHPSYTEGLPNAVCEALACARPVIASDIPEHSVLVQDGKSGFIFKHDDPSDLADKIREIMKLNACDRNKMGLLGRKFAENNLSLNRLVDEYEYRFNVVLNKEQDPNNKDRFIPKGELP